jgi:hypothetical protein
MKTCAVSYQFVCGVASLNFNSALQDAMNFPFNQTLRFENKKVLNA